MPDTIGAKSTGTLIGRIDKLTVRGLDPAASTTADEHPTRAGTRR